MAIDKCPLCNSSDCSFHPCDWDDNSKDNLGIKIRCKTYDREFIVHKNIDCCDPIELEKRYNLLTAFLLKTPKKKTKNYEYLFKFFYDKDSIGKAPEDRIKVNLANEMVNYPTNITEKIDAILLNLGHCYPSIGEEIKTALTKYRRMFFCESTSNVYEVSGICSFLLELNYFAKKGHSTYTISAHGWKRIEELLRQEHEIKQGFIAMSFEQEAQYIGEVFHKVITECGYNPCRIDEKEHNNQIVPEILYEIKRSKFMVVDVTVPNYGAYYEAGFGEALGKQVIVCCKDDVFDSPNKPHFDIAQKSTVIWKNPDDLKEKLKKRIEITVGLGK